MSNSTVIVEGCLKFRDGKKWKSRWAVITKLSPVADCLHLQIYRDSKDRCKNASTKSSLSLDGFLAIETGFTLEKESHTIAIICKDLIVLLAFDTRELLIQWQVKIKAHLTEEQHFLVQMTSLPAKSKLSCGPARLHLQDHNFSLVSGIPPRLLGFWPIKELRRFGVIDGKFCFEGGSHCGKGAGLHVLHTNRSEELAKCFELALNGRLYEKRRLSSYKNSSIDGSVRMSLQQTKCHKSCECGSNESSRPLISSGSEGSVCDACSEIIRYNGSNGSNEDNEISGESDDHYSSRSTCSTVLGCSSNRSCIGSQTYLSSPNAVTDNECFMTSHHSLGILNTCADNRCSLNGFSNIDCNTLPKCNQNENRSSWSTSSCMRCGSHYWADLYGCPSEDTVLSTKTLTNNTLSAINLSEFRSISPSSSSSMRECFRHNNNHTINNINKNVSILPDRASLCSQSSQSSGESSSSSNGSGSHSSGHSCHCGSEYSVPRTHQKPALILDSLYDKPKNFQHKLCNNLNKKEQMAVLCSCQLDQLDVTNKSVVTSGQRIIPSTIKTNGFSGNGNNLSVIHLKDYNPIMNQTIEETGEQHYSVPRTALANIYLKELKASQNSLSDNVIKNIENCCGEQYDFPRKFKESLTQTSDQSIQCICWCGVSSAQLKRNSNSSFESNASISDASNDMIRTTNNNTVLTYNCHQIPGKVINQCMVSLSQNCDPKPFRKESEPMLTRFRVQRLQTITGRNETTDKQLVSVDVCPNCPETIGINKVRDKQRITTDNREEQSRRCRERVNVVNSEHNLSNDCQTKAKQSTSLQNVNYVNMRFVQSIPLYENMQFIPNNGKDNKIIGQSKASVPQSNYEKRNNCSVSVLNGKNLEEKSIESIDDYILMQPIISTETTYLEEKTSQKSMENILVNPSIQHLMETTVNSNKNKSLVFKNIQFRPFNQLKRRLSHLKRSNSSERENDPKVCISSPNTSSCPSSPALHRRRRLSNRQIFIGSKLSFKSKEKSFSIDDISSAQLSLPNNHFMKFGDKVPFHKSADCLKQRTDDYRSSDEDMCTSSQITVLCASPVRTGHMIDNKVMTESSGIVVGNTSSLMTNGLKTESRDQKNLNNCLNFADSTSSSDMSDYMETLSLSSGTSSGSDPSYVRNDDLTQRQTTIESKQYSENKMIDSVSHSQKGITHQMDSHSPGCQSETSSQSIESQRA